MPDEDKGNTSINLDVVVRTPESESTESAQGDSEGQITAEVRPEQHGGVITSGLPEPAVPEARMLRCQTECRSDSNCEVTRAS